MSYLDARTTILPPPYVSPSNTITVFDRYALKKRQAVLERRLAGRWWLVRMLLVVVGLEGLLLGVSLVATGMSLREYHHAVVLESARTQAMEDAWTRLRDLAKQHPATPDSYRALHAQGLRAQRQREQFNRSVATYNRTSDVPLLGWVRRWFHLPRSYQRLSRSAKLRESELHQKD